MLEAKTQRFLLIIKSLKVAPKTPWYILAAKSLWKKTAGIAGMKVRFVFWMVFFSLFLNILIGIRFMFSKNLAKWKLWFIFKEYFCNIYFSSHQFLNFHWFLFYFINRCLMSDVCSIYKELKLWSAFGFLERRLTNKMYYYLLLYVALYLLLRTKFFWTISGSPWNYCVT